MAIRRTAERDSPPAPELDQFDRYDLFRIAAGQVVMLFRSSEALPELRAAGLVVLEYFEAEDLEGGQQLFMARPTAAGRGLYEEAKAEASL